MAENVGGSNDGDVGFLAVDPERLNLFDFLVDFRHGYKGMCRVALRRIVSQVTYTMVLVSMETICTSNGPNCQEIFFGSLGFAAAAR
jgi:hypothetical protein